MTPLDIATWIGPVALGGLLIKAGGILARFDAALRRLDKHEHTMGAHVERLSGLDKRVTRIEDRMGHCVCSDTERMIPIVVAANGNGGE